MNRIVGFVLFFIGVIGNQPAFAQQLTVEDVKPWACRQLGGTPSGNSCSAPYRPFNGGDACSIYNGLDQKTPNIAKWFRESSASCTDSIIEDAKVRTLESRSDLRGYVTYGLDESVNDPVVTPSFRPSLDGPYQPAERYFAAECVVRKCGSGGGDGSQPQVDPKAVDREVQSLLETMRKMGEESSETPKPSEPPVESEPETSENGATYTLKVCNKSRAPIMYIAIGYYENPTDRQLTITGWYQVKAGQCSKILPYKSQDYTGLFGDAMVREVYIHGEGWIDGTKWYWTTDTARDAVGKWCVSEKAFSRLNSPHYYCKNENPKEELVGFFQVKIQRDFSKDTGHYESTFTLH